MYPRSGCNTGNFVDTSISDLVCMQSFETQFIASRGLPPLVWCEKEKKEAAVNTAALRSKSLQAISMILPIRKVAPFTSLIIGKTTFLPISKATSLVWLDHEGGVRFHHVCIVMVLVCVQKWSTKDAQCFQG